MKKRIARVVTINNNVKKIGERMTLKAYHKGRIKILDDIPIIEDATGKVCGHWYVITGNRILIAILDVMTRYYGKTTNKYEIFSDSKGEFKCTKV